MEAALLSFRGHLAVTTSMQHVAVPRAALNLTPNWVIEIATNWQAHPTENTLAFNYSDIREIWFEIRKDYIYELHLAVISRKLSCEILKIEKKRKILKHVSASSNNNLTWLNR